MLVSSPVEKQKGRTSGLQSKNNGNSPESERSNKNKDNTNETEHDESFRNKSDRKSLRHRDSYESRNSRPASRQSDATEKESNQSSKLFTKQTISQDSDTSPDNSPVKPQNQSQTLFTQRALRKMKLSEEKAKTKEKKSSENDKETKTSDTAEKKNSPVKKKCPDQSYERNKKLNYESKNDGEKNKDHNELNDRRSDRNKKVEMLHEGDKSERERNEKYDKDKEINKNFDRNRKDKSERKGNEINDRYKESPVKTTKVLDLREKLRLKRQLREPPDLTKQNEPRVSRFGKRRLRSDDQEDIVKRRKCDKESKDNKISVEAHTTVIDEEIQPKSIMIGTIRSREEKNGCDDKLKDVTKSGLKEKTRNIITYSETDLLDTKITKTTSLLKAFEKEKAAKTEIDRLKRLMEGSSSKGSSRSKQIQCLATDPSLEVKDKQTENIEPSVEVTNETEMCVPTQNEKAEIEFSKKSATKSDAEVTADTDLFLSDDEVSITENVNRSDKSDLSMLYANIGEVTLETSFRSAASDNFDVEIFGNQERENDNVSSSSTNVAEKNPSPLSPSEGKPLKDSFEITSTVSEDNVVNQLEERCDSELKESAIIKNNSNMDKEANSSEKMNFLVKDNTEVVDVDLVENDTVAKDILRTSEGQICYAVNETNMEDLNDSKVHEKSLLSSSFDSEPENTFKENGVCSSRKKKKKKHKRDRKKRRSKSSERKLSNQSTLEDTDNEICDQTEKMTITPELNSGFEKSTTLSKQRSVEKQFVSSRTPKSEKDTSLTVFRGVISETVSTTTSNIIDQNEVFLSPARPIKSKRRSKSGGKVEKTPVKLDDKEVGKISTLEKLTEKESDIEKSNQDNGVTVEVNDKGESEMKVSNSKEETRPSLSESSVGSNLSGSDGSFGSNILSEKTSSLSLNSDLDVTESSFSSTSGSSFVSASTTSVASSSMQESTESDASESQSCEKLDNNIENTDRGEVLEVDAHKKTFVTELAPTENKNDSSDKMTTETLGTDCNKAIRKTSVTKSNLVDVLNEMREKSPLKTKNLMPEKDIAASSKVNNVDTLKDDEVTECVEVAVQSRRRHHTDGCLIANAANDTKRLHKRTVSADRSQLLQCLLNEIASICDRSSSNNGKTKKKVKNMSNSRKRSLDTLKTSMVELSARTMDKTNLERLANYDDDDDDDQICVQDDESEVETSQSESTVLQDNTITNDFEETEEEILPDQATKNREISAEELVFGSWTGLSIAAPKSNVSSSLNLSKFDINITDRNSLTDLRVEEGLDVEKNSNKSLDLTSNHLPELFNPLVKQSSSESVEENTQYVSEVCSDKSPEVLPSQSSKGCSSQSSESVLSQTPESVSSKSSDSVSSRSSEVVSSQSLQAVSSESSETVSSKSLDEHSSQSSEALSSKSSEVHSSQSSDTVSSHSGENICSKSSSETLSHSPEKSSQSPDMQSSQTPEILPSQSSLGISCHLSEHNSPEYMETETHVDMVNTTNNQETTETGSCTQATSVPDKKAIGTPIKSHTDSNPYFEMDEQPDFLNTGTEVVPSFSESGFKSSFNSSSVNNTVVIESEPTLTASSDIDVDKTDNSMNRTFDFVNSLKKSPHKVKMVKRTSPSKLKHSRVDTTKSSVSNSIKNVKPTYTGYFTSPEKQTINPLKSVSADNILTCILNRNVTDIQQKLASPSKQRVTKKSGDNLENQISNDSINALKETVESSSLENGKNNNKLPEKPNEISELIELSDTDYLETGESYKVTTKADTCDENSTQRSGKISDTVNKDLRAAHFIDSSEQNNKSKSKSPSKKSNERVSKHTKQTYDHRKTSVIKSRTLEKDIQKSNIKGKSSLIKTKETINNNFDSKRYSKSNKKESLKSASPLRRSPRKKCSISSMVSEHVGLDSKRSAENLNKEGKEKRNKDATENNKTVRTDRDYATKEDTVTDNKLSSERIDNLQKTPSESKYVSIFDDSESPAKNTRSATKLNGEKTVNTRGKTDLLIIDKVEKTKHNTSCKKNLAFSKDTSTNRKEIKDDKLKSNGAQRKLLTENASSKGINKLENKSKGIRPNSDIIEPVSKIVNKPKNSIKSADVNASAQNKSDSKVRSLMENRSLGISPRKSQGYTDLLKASRKESFYTISGTLRNKQIPDTVKTNSGSVPKTNTLDTYNVGNEKKISSYKQKEKVFQASVPKEVGNTKISERRDIENIIVGKISDIDKVIEKTNKGIEQLKDTQVGVETKNDCEQLKDTQKLAEIPKPYRIPKLKPGQQKDSKTSDSVLKSSYSKNQFPKSGNRSQVINDKVGSKSNSYNSYSVQPNRKQPVLPNVSEKLAETEPVGRSFADIISESDSFTKKEAKRKTERQKSGHGSHMPQDNAKEQKQLPKILNDNRNTDLIVTQTHRPQRTNEIIRAGSGKSVESCNLEHKQLSELDTHKRKVDAIVMQTSRPQKTNEKVRNSNGKSAESSNLYAGVGERTSKFGKISYDDKVVSEFENDRRNGHTDNGSEQSSVEIAQVRQSSQRPSAKSPRKDILDKIKKKVTENSDKTNKEKYDRRNTLAETHTSESEFPRTESDSCNSFASDTDSDKESDMTDRTPVLNRMLFGSDSSGDESNDLYQYDSPAKLKRISNSRPTIHKARYNIDSPKGSKHLTMKEFTKKTKDGIKSRKISQESNEEIETEMETTIKSTDKNRGTVSDTVTSCFESSTIDHVDEETQCSFLLNTSSDSNFRVPKVRHVSGIVNSSIDGAQTLSSSIATSTSGTLLLDCEDTLDHTDYVDSLLHERSIISNTSLMSPTSKSDYSYNENSSHESDVNNSLEDGEVMSSDNEAVKNSPLKPKRITEKHGISGLVGKEDRLKLFSPVKFPEKNEKENSEKSNLKTKSVRISEVWKECLVGNKSRNSNIESETIRKSSRDAPRKGLRDDRRRKERSCSHSPRRRSTEDLANTNHGKSNPRTPKSRNETSASTRKRSNSRSPRPSRRSRSHSPRSIRKRLRSRSFSRSPRRRHRSRSRSRERKDYSRCRHNIPDPCLSKANRRRSPLPVTPHRSRHRNSPPRHRNTSPYYRSRRYRSRSRSASLCSYRRSRRDPEHDSPHHHRHSECDKGRQKYSHCCEIERKDTCCSKTCSHGSKSDTRSTEHRSRHSPERNSRHSHRHEERSCQKRKRRSHSSSGSEKSRSRSRERHDHKPKRQRANLSKHFDCSSDEND